MTRFEDLVPNKFTSEYIIIDSNINVVVFKDIKFSDIIFNDDKFKYLGQEITYITSIEERVINFQQYDLYFTNCSFLGNLELNKFSNRSIRCDNCSFTNITLKDIVRNNEKSENGFILKNIKSIQNLTIDSCEFYGKFYINKQDDESNNEVNIETLIIKNTEFKTTSNYTIVE